MLYVALVVGAVALFLAWRCSRSVRYLKERNARLNSQLHELRLEMHSADEEQWQALTQARFELMRQAGNLRVTGDMTVNEITTLHPQAATILAGFHIGGCASCAVDGATRLDQAVVASGGSLEPVLVALNDLVTESADGMVPEESLRMPNVQLAI
jgi:hypothetical protein